jgi:HAD superfamily hydrolase (TIGR01509 family)
MPARWEAGSLTVIRAVIFDMDGLLLDSETFWGRARTDYCRSQGCEWTEQDELGVKGHNSPEWASKIKESCALEVPESEIIAAVAGRMEEFYRERLPLLPGAQSVVRHLSERYPLAIASSSPPELIRFAMERAEILQSFRVIVSADEVGKGKPAPDVFLAAARKLESLPQMTAVFEDSSAGIAAGKAAGMFVIAVPNASYPPSDEALEKADVVLSSLEVFNDSLLPSENLAEPDAERTEQAAPSDAQDPVLNALGDAQCHHLEDREKQTASTAELVAARAANSELRELLQGAERERDESKRSAAQKRRTMALSFGAVGAFLSILDAVIAQWLVGSDLKVLPLIISLVVFLLLWGAVAAWGFRQRD